MIIPTIPYSINNYKIQNRNISFNGSKNNGLSPNIQEGIKIGKKLSKSIGTGYNQLSNIEQILNASSPVPIEVLPLSELPEQMRNLNSAKILAHMVPMYDYGINLSYAKIHIPISTKNAKERNQLIATIAHEYTHVLQREQDKNYYGIKNLTNNINDTVIIARNAQRIMQEGVGRCYEKLFSNPKNIQSTLDARLKEKFDTQKALKDININNEINSCTSALTSGQPQVIKAKIKRAIISWIKQETANEVEAYTVSENVLRQLGKYDVNYMAKILILKDLYEYLNKSVNE